MKEHIQEAIGYHREQADNLWIARNKKIAQVKALNSYDADTLLSYGNALKGLEIESSKHALAISSLLLLLSKA